MWSRAQLTWLLLKVLANERAWRSNVVIRGSRFLGNPAFEQALTAFTIPHMVFSSCFYQEIKCTKNQPEGKSVSWMFCLNQYVHFGHLAKCLFSSVKQTGQFVGLVSQILQEKINGVWIHPLGKWFSRCFKCKLRWLDWIFWGGYLPSLSINYVGMSKDMGRRSPQLYYIKMENSYDQGFIAIGVAMAT